MAQTRLTSQSTAERSQDRSFEQGGIGGIVDFLTQNPLIAIGAVVVIVVLFMMLSGGGGREEIIRRAAEQAAGEVTG